jgi:hypothetical protein
MVRIAGRLMQTRLTRPSRGNGGPAQGVRRIRRRGTVRRRSWGRSPYADAPGAASGGSQHMPFRLGTKASNCTLHTALRTGASVLSTHSLPTTSHVDQEPGLGWADRPPRPAR